MKRFRKTEDYSLEKICSALNVTLIEFFAEERPQLEPELRRLVETARKLSQ